MIDQEKKEIREMHNVVTQLMDRPEKVEFRDMYSLVPQISYIDEVTILIITYYNKISSPRNIIKLARYKN